MEILCVACDLSDDWNYITRICPLCTVGTEKHLKNLDNTVSGTIMYVYIIFVVLQCDRASSNWWLLCWKIGTYLPYCQWETALFWPRDASISHLRAQGRQGRNHCGIVWLSQ